MRKIINSTSPKYEDQITEELIFDTAPTVNSFNAVTSDGVARAIAGASGEVPQVTENDNGKVLTAIYDAGGPAVEWGSGPTVDQTYDADSTNAQSGVAVAEAIAGISIPTVDQAYDADSTNAQSGVAVAGAISSVRQVPSSASGDSGKVLTVNSQGTPAWATPAAPSGGSDEWWGGDPGRVTLPEQTLRLMFKDTTYDPRNETDTSFTEHFSAITKVSDGVYDFTFANATGLYSGEPLYANAFQNKYTGTNEFIVIAFNAVPATSDRVINTASMFDGCTGLRAAYNFACGGDNRNGNLELAFNGCTALAYFGVLEQGYEGSGDFRVSVISSMSFMFKGCTSLVDCNMEISQVTNTCDCNYMFQGCSSLVTGPAFGPVLRSATCMFDNCVSLRGFHTVNNTLEYKLATNVGGSQMFYNCRSLENVDALSYFFSGTFFGSASDMFNGCKALKRVPYIHLQSSASVPTSGMFRGCISLEAVPEMDWESVSSMSTMFAFCISLTSTHDKASGTQWYAGTLNANLADVASMFNGCFNIREGLKDCYDALSANAGITSYSNCFANCGVAFSNPELAQIPSSWGGTGT